MELLSMLNVVLAMAGIYLLLSLVASGINERIAAALGARSKHLRAAIKQLLGPALTEKFEAHALVTVLHEPGPSGGEHTSAGRFPSYVRSGTFAAVVLDLLREEGRRSAVALAREGIQPSSVEADAAPQKGLALVLKEGIRRAERAGASAELDALPHLEAALAEHFDSTMERVSGWYRRQTQRWLFGIAILLTLVLNLDSLALAGALWADPALAEGLADTASAYVEETRGKASADGGGGEGAAATTEPDPRELWERLRRARVGSLPLGWTEASVTNLTHDAQGNALGSVAVGGNVVTRLCGWLISVFAIAAGAPFWFDMIAKVTNLRAAGGVASPPAPTTKDDGATERGPPGAGAGLAPPRSSGLPTALRAAPQRRKALLAAEAADLAYQRDAKERASGVNALGLAPFATIDDLKTGTFVLLARARDGGLLVAFRGTEPTTGADWKTDLAAGLKFAEDGAEGREHAGFAAALDAVYEKVEAWRRESGANAPLLVCGHSLGGALACLYARAVVASTRAAGQTAPPLTLITFGCPRVGDAAHAAALNRLVPEHLRFVRDDDLVARVPTRSMGYRHAGTVLFFDRTGVLNTEPAGWVQFLNRAVIGTEDLKTALLKGVTDHSMAQYLRLVRNAFDGEDESSPAES